MMSAEDALRIFHDPLLETAKLDVHEDVSMSALKVILDKECALTCPERHLQSMKMGLANSRVVTLKSAAQMVKTW